MYLFFNFQLKYKILKAFYCFFFFPLYYKKQTIIPLKNRNISQLSSRSINKTFFSSHKVTLQPLNFENDQPQVKGIVNVPLPLLRRYSMQNKKIEEPLENKNQNIEESSKIINSFSNDNINHIKIEDIPFFEHPEILIIPKFNDPMIKVVSPFFEPFSETIPPIILSLSSFKYFCNSIKFPKVPPLPEIQSNDFINIYILKMKICSYIFDFSNNTILIEEKDIKSRALCEIVQFFEQSIEVKKLSIDLQEQTFKMLYSNIYSQSPIFPSKLISNNYNTVIVDPSWPHLFYTYQILNRFIQIFPNYPEININLIKKTLNLINLPDNNERLQLLAFLRSFYDTHPNDRIKLLKLISYQLNDFILGLLPPYCITPLLVLLAHIFSRSNKNLTIEFKNIIINSVFPLILTPYLYFFNTHLIQLFSSVFSNNSPLILLFFEFLRKN